ncbi:MAG: hypothetical protein AAF391_04345 [Bacteroidota bacterium]
MKSITITLFVSLFITSLAWPKEPSSSTHLKKWIEIDHSSKTSQGRQLTKKEKKEIETALIALLQDKTSDSTYLVIEDNYVGRHLTFWVEEGKLIFDLLEKNMPVGLVDDATDYLEPYNITYREVERFHPTEPTRSLGMLRHFRGSLGTDVKLAVKIAEKVIEDIFIASNYGTHPIELEIIVEDYYRFF